MNTFNYYQYEKKHLKPLSYRAFMGISLLWLFLNAAVEASTASRASEALETAVRSGYSPETFSLNLFQFDLCFMITISTLNSSLFYIREMGQQVPVLSKYLFAPVEVRKMYRAKAFLLMRGACLFYISGLAIYFAAAGVTFGAGAPFAQLLNQFGSALIFCIVVVSIALLANWHQYRQAIAK